jgi:small subunit ribosomal protein S5
MSEEKNDHTTAEETTANKAHEKSVAEKTKTGTAPTDEKKDERRPRRSRARNDRRREPKEFEESIVHIARVTRVTKGGRQMRFRVSVVIGDKKGRIGFGIGKSGEVMLGVQKAVSVAKKNLVRVPIFQDTIPHTVVAKYKATKLTLMPAPEGKGVIAGGPIRRILELAGIKNALSKIHGSRNSVNVTRAAFEALAGLANQAPYKPKSEVENQTEEAPKSTEKIEKSETKKPIAKKKVTQKKTAK